MQNYILKKFLKEFNNKKVYYDPDFQRRVVWTKENVDKFFSSLSKGWDVTPIVVLDIALCLEYCEELGDEVSIEYFQDLVNKGYKYVSLDGQNRTKNIQKVLNNKITLSTELTVPDYNDDDKYDTVNQFYKDLPFEVRHHIMKGCDIPVVVIGEATRQDASDIFKSLNDGMPLTPQEIRQCESSPIAEVVRELSSRYATTTERLLAEDKISRMEDDETIAKFLMVLFREHRDGGEVVPSRSGLSTTDIDDFYKKGVGFNNVNDPASPYLLTEIDRAKTILKLFSAVILNQTKVRNSKLIPKKNQWAILYACEWIHDNDYRINDYNQFYNALKEIDDSLYTESLEKYTQDRQAYIQNDKDPDECLQRDYYFKWINLPHQLTPRAARKRAIIGEMKNQKMHNLTMRLKSDKINKAA